MSIDTGTPDAYAPPALNCNACHAVNETPLYKYAAISGVLKGDLWNPADPPPPNGLWKLETQMVCTWFNFFPNWEITLMHNIPNTALTVRIPFVLEGFSAVEAGACTRYLPNVNQVPAGNHYYSGQAVIYDFTAADDSTLQENLALMNIEAQEGTYVNIRSAEGDTAVKIISSHRQDINIAIKEEIP